MLQMICRATPMCSDPENVRAYIVVAGVDFQYSGQKWIPGSIAQLIEHWEKQQKSICVSSRSL
jgi:hypothetical protein